MRNITFGSLLLLTSLSFAQSKDEQMLKEIYSFSLTRSNCYSWLDDLSNKIGSRMSGSDGAQKGVEYTKAIMESLGLDKVWLQEVMVPKWVRGEKESAYILDNTTKTVVPITALGGSVATPQDGLSAEVVEVNGLDDLKRVGTEKIKGKIVFYNQPIEPENINTFDSYCNCKGQRYWGAKEAAKFGAVGAIIRSVNFRLDDFPHTGMQTYDDLSKERYIPTAAISTNGAELLSRKLKDNPHLKFYFKQSCYSAGEVLSYNVIGEITGTEHPDKIMIVGGHLDSWDLADGSQDDGAGCVQSMEVLEIFKKLNYKPKNTIRVVLFMNEEFGGRGGKKYAELSKLNRDNHIFAMESDSGGFSPIGFNLKCNKTNFKKVCGWGKLFAPYFVHNFVKGYTGNDIRSLTSSKIVKVGLKLDSQRYFDYHHAATDTFDSVDKRELELGAASMTALVYLFDQYGID